MTANVPLRNIVDRIRATAVAEQITDADLLARYVENGDETAMTEIVRRHGPMVWGVCIRALYHQQDAEDCYQATFLVLVRKATTVHPRFTLGAWLHGVACKIVQKARAFALKQRSRVRSVGFDVESAARAEPDRELRCVIDQELAAMPEKYRLPIVLCELEGRTLNDVAKQLGCPIGTVAGRLARARKILGKRLVRRGFSGGTTGIAVLVADTARSAFPTVSMSAASSQAVTWAKSVAVSLSLSKLKMFVSASVIVLLLCAGAGFYSLIWSSEHASDEKQPTIPLPDQKTGNDSLGVIKKFGNIQFLHPGEVSHVLFSADGKEIATFGGGTLQWWNLSDGTAGAAPIKNTPPGNTLLVSADNSTLVKVGPAAGFGSIMAAFDPRTGRSRVINVANNVGLTGLSVSHNGKWAVGFGGKTVVVWDLLNSKKTASFEVPEVNHVAVSNDGKRVAVVSRFNLTEVRASGTGEVEWELSKAYPEESYQFLAFSPDGKRLATAGINVTKGEPGPAPIRLWDIENKKDIWHQLPTAQSMGSNLQFSPDGKVVGVVFHPTLTPTLYLLDTDTGKVAHEFSAGKGANGHYSISNDGKRVAMGAGRRLQLWEMSTHQQPTALVGPRSPAQLIARSPDGQYVATGNGGTEVWVWDARKTAPNAVRASDGYWAFDLGFSSDSKRLVTVTRGNANPVRVWDVVSGKHLYSLGYGADKLHRAAFGRHGLFAVLDYKPGLYDQDTGKEVWTGNVVPTFGNNEPLVVISPKAEFFATNAAVFSIKDGRQATPFAAGFPLAVADDGLKVAYKTKDGKVGLYLTNATKQPEAIPVGSVFAVSPQCDRLAVVVETSLRVYDLTTAKLISECQRPSAVDPEAWKKWWARKVVFSSDAKRVAAHADTMGLGVWYVETGKAVAWFVPEVSLPIATFTFTNPTTLVSAYGHGDLIHVWNVDQVAPR